MTLTRRSSCGSAWHRVAAVAPLLGLLAACADEGMQPQARMETPVQVSASLTGSPVEWLSVEVTASDIAVPVVVTLAATGTTARGTITVPPGPARTFTARGYDVEGTLTHRAVSTGDVAPGTAGTLALVLRPVTDGAASGTGDDLVTLSAADVALAVNGTRRLGVTVTRADGAAVPGAPVTWATLDPAVATVSRTGLIVGIAPGTTQVVALSGGGAAVANVVVQ